MKFRDSPADPDWKQFAEMANAGARAVRQLNPELKIVLGVISPIGPKFIHLLSTYGVLDEVDVVSRWPRPPWAWTRDRRDGT